MPEYDHKCKDCGHEFSVNKPIAQVDRVERCPACGGATARKWGAVNVRNSSECRPSSGFG